MKFLIFSGFGDFRKMPKELSEIYNKNLFPYNRINEIIEYLEKQEKVEVNENESNIINRLKKEKKVLNIITKTKKNCYYFYDEELKNPICMKIIDIDTSIPWKIVDYDGAEGIQYFKEPEIIDKNINLAKF